MKRMGIVLGFLGLMAVMSIAQGQWQDTGFVQNNSFEADGLPGGWPFYTCTISGWTTGGCNHMINSDASGPFHEVAHLGNVPHGTYVAGTQGAGTLSQNISGLVNGRWYRLDLYVNERFNDGGYMDLRIWMGSQVLYGPTQITPRNPYYFLQMQFQYNSAWGNTLILETLNPTGDATILFDYVRIFTPLTYTVGYSSNPAAGGSISGPGSINHTGTPGDGITATVSTNAGYSVSGVSASNGTITPAGGNNYNLAGVTANTIVTANFTPNTYTVTFNGNGGSAPSPGSKSVTYNATYGALATTSRTGYAFNGWYTASTGGTLINSGTTVTTASNHTLYAQWTPNNYTVTFNANGGTAAVPPSKSVTFGSTYGALAATSRTGYSFEGWFTQPTGGSVVTSGTTVNTASDHTLYAQWTPNNYTVTFNANGGTAPVPGTKGVTYDAAYGPLATTSFVGHTFNGWFTASTGGTLVTAATIMTTASNHTLYAQWTINTYTVTFDLDGKGTRTGGGDLVQTVEHGAGAVAPTVSADTGWVFDGWDAAFDNITGPLTVTALYSVATYTVTFDLDGKGTRTGGGELVQTVEHGAGAVAPTVSANTGWVFDGWDVAFDNITAPLTVTALYSVATYTVTFDLDGKGTRTGGGELVQTVEHGAAAVAPTVSADTGWVFDGWDAAFDNITGPLTVTALYSVATYPVTFDLDGKGTRTGGGDLVQTVAHGDAAVAPVVSANTGWVFDGWDVAFDTITGPLTVTAQYSVATYTVTFDLDGKGTRTGGGDLVQTVAHGDAAVAPTVAGNPGWVFVAWDAAFDNITGDLTVTALYDVAPEGEGEGEGEGEDEGEPEGESEGEGEGEGEPEGEPEGEGEPPVGLVVNAVGDTYFIRPLEASVTFAVQVQGNLGALTYQWYKLTDDKAQVPVGPDGPLFTIDPIAEADFGEYLCEVYDPVLDESASSPVFTLVYASGLPGLGLLGIALAGALTAFAGAGVVRRRT